MRFLLISWLFLLIPMSLSAQENAAIEDLLQEAQTKLYSKPEQTGKITEYIITQNESPAINAKAMLLLAKSFYVRGNYNEASKNALDAKQLADQSTDNEMKLKSGVFAVLIMRQLGLETVATNYSDELATLENKIQDKKLRTWLSGKLKQDSSFVNFQIGKFLKAKTLLQESKQVFLKINDTLATKETEVALAETYIKSDQLDSAKISLESILRDTVQEGQRNFQDLQALAALGSIYFLEKNYSESIQVLNEALSISLKLPNKQYENRSAQELAINYLALEDTKNFFSYKQKANLTSTEVETDRNLAVNSVYNFINISEKEFSKQRIHQGYLWIYILGGLFLFILIAGIIVNYYYILKAKEYGVIWKYIQPKQLQNAPTIVKETLEKSSIVPEETEQLLLQKLERFEAGKKFIKQDMSIALLASQFDTNTKYLSEVINRQKGKNFNSYINELRINYIIEKLKTDSVYFNYKISYLAEESGFSSHSSFATVFKSVTGISPTKFMDFLQKKQETA